MLEGLEPDESRENKVIVNLRRALNRLSPEQRKGLVLEFVTLHLKDTNPEILVEEHENSNDLTINIVELARSIASAQGRDGLAYVDIMPWRS